MNSLINLTPQELIEALREGLGLAKRSEGEPLTPTTPKKHYVYGLKGLANLLGCSRATAARIKKSGVLDAAISQVGKIILVDADLAVDLIKIRKPKLNKKIK